MIADWEINGVFLANILQERFPDLFEQIQAILTSHGVQVRLLSEARDIWARDFCPIQFDSKRFIKFRYDPDYLKGYPELCTGDEVVTQYRELGECLSVPIVLDGGNVIASRTKAIMTDKIYKENPCIQRHTLRKQLQDLLGVDQLIIIPKEPYEHFGHADSIVRFIDDNTVLVNDYRLVDPGFERRLAKVLLRHKLVIESIPYVPEAVVLDGVHSAIGCYSNYLRTKRVVIVPAFCLDQDRAALSRLEALLPGIPILSLDCTGLAREGGVLNCVAATYRLEKNPQTR
jgi:agmatine deiminase